MKKLIFTVTTILILTLIISVIPTESEAQIYDDTVRLHILARSDSDEDQKTKLEIRDRLLKKYGNILASYKTVNEANAALADLVDEINSDIDAWLVELGCDYTAEVVIGEEWYDTREYEGFTLPKGVYSSLRVILGGGEGKNWWCVMFPPMCLDVALENAPPDDGAISYTEAETRLITKDGYFIKFKLLELASEMVEKLSRKG